MPPSCCLCLLAIPPLRDASLGRVGAVGWHGEQGRGRPEPLGFIRHAHSVAVYVGPTARSAVRKASIKSQEHVEKGQGLSVSGNLQGRKVRRNRRGGHCEEGHPRPRAQLLSHHHCGYPGWPHARLFARHYPHSVIGSSEQPTEAATTPSPSFRMSKLKLQGVKPLAQGHR